MTKDDFLEIIKAPKPVLVGLLCQFTIMPLLGYTLTKVFSFPAEIAAGIILIGCSPSGLASNVMAYIAKANVALSVTITSIATLLAPVLTPALMKLLGGEYIEIDFWKMFWEIVQMIIFPIIAGLVLSRLAGANLMARLNKLLPLLSMGGIVVIIAIITAAGHDSLTKVGLSLIAAVILHNCLGYVLGYFSARAVGLVERDARTVAIEVGLQNAGMASGLAVAMNKIATMGVAPALFGPIMNTTGSLLAGWWSKR
jgi:bile acid:Na+ symporter, BASS family